jgi:hypothetical protein
MKDLKLWLSISNLRNVPHSLLLYSRIADYANEDLFEISDDEDEYEVLRRVSSDQMNNAIYRLKVKSTS